MIDTCSPPNPAESNGAEGGIQATKPNHDRHKTAAVNGGGSRQTALAVRLLVLTEIRVRFGEGRPLTTPEGLLGHSTSSALLVRNKETHTHTHTHNRTNHARMHVRTYMHQRQPGMASTGKREAAFYLRE